MSDILVKEKLPELWVRFESDELFGRSYYSLTQGFAERSKLISLDRAELQALYGRIQDVMAGELIAAGWLDDDWTRGVRYFAREKGGDLFALDAAHHLMREAQNAE
jgi:hypothetical protein